MKKQFWVLPLTLVLSLILTGCGFGGGHTEEEEHLEPLTAADWPTPQPTAAPPSPTPFPKISLEDVATSTAAPANDTAGSEVAALEANETLEAEDNAAASIAPVSTLGNGLSPVASAFVTADSATIRQGPGESYGSTVGVEKGELAGVLGQNDSGDWLYVLTASLVQGWLPAEAMHVNGSFAEAPVLPPNPVAPAVAQAASSNSVSTGSSSRQQAPAMANLEPVTTAQVASARLNVRQRPGGSYKQLMMLDKGAEVAILALNRDKDWALIETGDNQLGWVSVDFLDVDGSLANAPQVRTLEPTSANEVAPVVPLAGSGQVSPSSSSRTDDTAVVQSQPAVIPAAVNLSHDQPPAAPDRTLFPVASALVNTKVDSRRGPGATYGPVDELTVDLPVEILARNEQENWVIVRTPKGSVGWTSLNLLNVVDGSVSNAAPVLTAWVKSNETWIYNGPGIYYDRVGALAIHDIVSIVALNEGRSWALVEALNGGQGWLPLRLIEISGSLADVPKRSAPSLGQSQPDEPGLPAPGPTSATTGKLVFQTVSGGDIMVVNADGTGLRHLTNGIDPVLSPDGQQVAFTRWTGDTGELWTINLDGSQERQILGQMRKAKGPAWSSDGSQIVLNFQQGGRPEENRSCHDAGRQPPRGAEDFELTLDGDGKPRVCWTTPPDPHWTLRVIQLTDGSFEDLDGGTYAFRPAWDPIQSWRIVSDGGRGLLAVDLNSETQQQKITDQLGDSSPVFSPDGRFLAVTVGKQGGSSGYDIYRLSRDGGGRVRLTQTPLWETVQPDSSEHQWNNVAPTWSPDGTLIAFLTDRTGRWEIWVMNVDGSNQRPMFSDEFNDQLALTYNFVDERIISWR